jgi:PAS domain S-box-containing protein
MWSFHDDIRRDLQNLIRELSSDLFDVKKFNRLTGNVYFNMYAIKFREEAILFPYAVETIRPEILDSLLPESIEMGFPYYNAVPPESSTVPENKEGEFSGKVDLQTGMPDAEQIRLIFNHLPVDITFVDENNKVRYFSTPGKRIFPRSKAIIGRDVNNCHPPESVHVVEEIIEAFRSGKESQASFWIKIKEELVLIRYFAVRDEAGQYRGVIEVSQEVSDIKALEGERRLLEWIGR